MHWLDVAKCLLIISVIVYHIPVFAEQNGVDGLGWMYNLRPLFKAYFMPTFFVITGFCSTFSATSFWQFVYKNFKLLMIPNFLIVVGTPVSSYLLSRNTDVLVYVDAVRTFFISGGFWFLTSLFFGKIIYFGLKRICNSMTLLGSLSLLFMIVGVMLHSMGVPNVWYIENTLSLVLFFWVGQMICKHQGLLLRVRSLVLIGAVYPVIILLYYIQGKEEPFITLHVSVEVLEIPVILTLAISGTLLCFLVSQWISKNRVLEYIGRETLTIYLFHMYFLLKLLPHLSGVIHKGTMGYATGVALVISTLVFCTIVNVVLNTKYFKWVLGKF